MAGWVDICNMTLTRIGEQVIENLDDENDAAEICNQHYAESVDQVLEAYDWVCARYRKSLAASTTTPAFGYDYQYDLPTNPYCLRLITVLDTEENPVEYCLEGREILCDTSDGLYIKYAKRIVDPTELNPLLAKAISLRLAKVICPKFGLSAAFQQVLESEFDAVVLLAKMSDACKDYSDDEAENPSSANQEWIDAGGGR